MNAECGIKNSEYSEFSIPNSELRKKGVKR